MAQSDCGGLDFFCFEVVWGRGAYRVSAGDDLQQMICSNGFCGRVGFFCFGVVWRWGRTVTVRALSDTVAFCVVGLVAPWRSHKPV